MKNERGFTLIELMVVVSIIGILAALMLTTFAVYKERAEFAKGETLLSQAITAFEVGDQDSKDGDSLALSETDTSGSPLPLQMQRYLPAIMMPRNVKLSASYDYCGEGAAALQTNQFLSVTPCSSKKRLQWVKFCNGLQVRQDELPNAGC